jgi:hypothetical protein
MQPPTFRRRSVEPTNGHQLDALVATGTVPAGLDSDWDAVSEVLRDANAPAVSAELTGETAALASFRQAQIGVPSRRPHQRPRMLSALITGKLAALALCTTAGVGSVATAAYANALPTPIQGFAHSTIGAPAPHEPSEHADAPVVAPASAPPSSHRREITATPTHHSEPPKPPKPTETPSSHPATQTGSTETKTTADVGPFSLCLAYHAAVEHHTALAAAMQARLVTFAGGTENIVAFCTKLLTPTASPTETHSTMTSLQLATYECFAIDRGVQLPASAQAQLAAMAGGTDRVSHMCAELKTKASATPTPAPHPVTTSLAIGLCNAYRHGTLPTQYVGRLNDLAGGADHVATFCASVPVPTTGPEPTHSSAPAQPPSSPVH